VQTSSTTGSSSDSASSRKFFPGLIGLPRVDQCES
jgi:hypothetical protein